YRAASDVLVAHSLEEAIEFAAADSETFVIGGGEIFQQALPLTTRAYVTWVEVDIAGDTQFPEWDPAQWRVVASERHAADAKNEYDTTFCIYDRSDSG